MLALSQDVLRVTWQYLDDRSLRRASRVCKRFQALTKEIFTHTVVEAEFLTRMRDQSPVVYKLLTPSTLSNGYTKNLICNEIVNSQFFGSISDTDVNELSLFDFDTLKQKKLQHQSPITCASICNDLLYVGMFKGTIAITNLKTSKTKEYSIKDNRQIVEVIGNGDKFVLVKTDRLCVYKIDDKDELIELQSNIFENFHVNAHCIQCFEVQFVNDKLYLIGDDNFVIYWWLYELDLKTLREDVYMLPEPIVAPRVFYHRSYEILNGYLFYINTSRKNLVEYDLVEYELATGKSKLFSFPVQQDRNDFARDLTRFESFLIYTVLSNADGLIRRTVDCFDTKKRKWVKIPQNPELLLCTRLSMEGVFQFLKNGKIIVENNDKTFTFYDYLRPVWKDFPTKKMSQEFHIL